MLFRSSLVCVTFSFQALEAFCNYSISRTWRKPVEVKKGKKKEVLHHVAAERAVSTEDKLKSILPQIYDVPTPSGKAIWERFIKLKRARDACVHIKAAIPDMGVEQALPLAEAECKKYGLKARVQSLTGPTTDRYIFACVNR